ncbi:MAG: hypothetical protein Q8R78_04330 [Candidatus Omnitrophota bacterium]|nr:hypothetical protein [Candidatus Omnitrophota bacterium]
MTKRERTAMRRSIIKGAVHVACEAMYGELVERRVGHDHDAWCEQRGTQEIEWRGPEVQEECQAVYSKLAAALIAAGKP